MQELVDIFLSDKSLSSHICKGEDTRPLHFKLTLITWQEKLNTSLIHSPYFYPLEGYNAVNLSLIQSQV